MSTLSAQFASLLLCLSFFSNALADRPVEKHGNLAIKGNQMVDSHGNAVSFAGPSFFWSNTGWSGMEFYNQGVVRYFVKDWNAKIIRAAIGSFDNGGYITHPKDNIERAETIIDAAIAEGIYVIVDWHSHNAEENPDDAIKFFTHIARKYGETPNVIYEIYNEPLKETSWSKVIKPYAQAVIPVIRQHDPDNIIVVGTRSWSQDVEEAAADPLDEFSNIAYTLHFYAASHKESKRTKAKLALEKGAAIMITEWGTVSASGDGGVDAKSTQEWMAFAKKHNISHCVWAINNKKEGASILKPGTKPDGNWTDDDLTPSGKLAKSIVLNW